MEQLDHHGGLGWAQLAPIVVDPKLAAPRGHNHTNAFLQHEAAYDGDSLFEGDKEEEEEEPTNSHVMTLDTAIPESNVGFQLLLKLGWSQGKGLGRKEDGIVEPIRTGVEEGVKLGLGKQEQDNFYTNTENVQRKRLETEIQANEDDARKERREALAEREAKIKAEVSDIKKTFYCEICHKQYNAAMELDVHLDSYDHHHKKRLIEMKAMATERTRGSRMKKEAKQMDRELAQLHKQIQKATAQKGQQGQEEASPPPPPPPPPLPSQPPSSSAPACDGEQAHMQMDAAEAPPPLPPMQGGFSISFGLAKKGPGAARGFGGAPVKRGAVMASPALAAKAPALAAKATAATAFGMSDSDDEASAP